MSKGHSMDNEKRKTQSRFNDQAIKEAVKRMTPELEAASEAAHKMKDSEDSGDDQDYRDFDRIVELGYLVEAVSGLCGPNLRLLTDIADALYAIDEGDKTPHKVGSKH
jgi:hypothetical protein